MPIFHIWNFAIDAHYDARRLRTISAACRRVGMTHVRTRRTCPCSPRTTPSRFSAMRRTRWRIWPPTKAFFNRGRVHHARGGRHGNRDSFPCHWPGRNQGDIYKRGTCVEAAMWHHPSCAQHRRSGQPGGREEMKSDNDKSGAGEICLWMKVKSVPTNAHSPSLCLISFREGL